MTKVKLNVGLAQYVYCKQLQYEM